MACLVAVTGSNAYGLAHANSDLDQMGVFIAPSSEVAGLNWNSHHESWTNTSPEGDDLTMHEIRKFLNLCLKGNPTLIELLFMNEYAILTDQGQEMVDLRSHIISEKTLRNSYYGYALSQYNRVAAEDEFKPKMARHTLRIARQGHSLLTTGTFDVKVSDPQEYFDLTELPKKDMLRIIETELNLLSTCDAVIPQLPNREIVADFLRSIRYEHP